MHATVNDTIGMPTEEIYSLTRKLSQIQIMSKKAIKTVEAANEQESRILRRIHSARSAERPIEDSNPHKLRDKVRISNKLRDEL